MPTKRKGILITFEGTEGAGKSTLIRKVDTALRRHGQKTVLTREPGGSAVAEKIRKLILTQTMDPWTEIFLYEAARAEHLDKIIRPALSKGKFVLCDRFTDSSLAYQSFARKLPWQKIKLLNHIATQGLKPNLTILIDIDQHIGLKRARTKNRFEEEGVAFHNRVRRGFFKARAENHMRWFTLAGKLGTPDQMAEAVIKEIKKRFKL